MAYLLYHRFFKRFFFQKMSDDVNDVEKEKRIIIIQTLLAFELFCQKRFEESLRNFANLNTGMHMIVQIYIKRFVDLVRILDNFVLQISCVPVLLKNSQTIC